MKELINIFRMEELSVRLRANLIIEMGILVNNQYGSNVSEPLVYELVNHLDPQNPKFMKLKPHYERMLK